ncbi:hypothetical protein PEB0149_001910 [Bartonella apis]|uniref:Uncharacterized protein n=1 Tax=Bartonella apis TaxID=1686310 RepID=A0A1R0F741_9HYPH|nr:hypothetical protein PEB0149_001910 [Bartonella apis]
MHKNRLIEPFHTFMIPLFNRALFEAFVVFAVSALFTWTILTITFMSIC